METRAHFIVIGLFTLFGIIGSLGFFIWLASVQIDRQYAQYGVLFENVSGLDASGDVLFNGISVGRVVGIRIWEKDPSLAYVEIEIDADTPVRADTVAQLESQGVTGVAYIALSGGSADAPRLVGTTDVPPLISSRRSSLQSLVSDAPDILTDAADIMEQLQAITGPENQQYLTNILRNLDGSTAELDAALTDFSDIAKTVSDATAQITVFTDRLDAIATSAQSTLAEADETLNAATSAFAEADTTLQSMISAIDNADAAFASMDRLINDDLSPLSDQLSTTLTNTDQALQSADDAFVQADAVMKTDLGPVIADIRSAATNLSNTMASIGADAPGIMTDIRGMISDVRAGVNAATPGLRDFGLLGGETRGFIRNLNDLVRQISRDPARFLLDERVPEYRR